MSNDGIVTVDSGGCVRLWETALASLDQSIEKWRGLIGKSDGKPLSVSCIYQKKHYPQDELVINTNNEKSIKIIIMIGVIFPQITARHK